MTDRRGRGGLTVAELAVVLSAAALLAGLAAPRLQRTILMAEAADVVEKLDAVRNAALRYRGEHGSWPEEVSPGHVPDGLRTFLPEEFAFAEEGRVLDWENWSDRAHGFVGVAVTTDDPRLGAAVLALLGDTGTWSDGRSRVSWLLEWS